MLVKKSILNLKTYQPGKPIDEVKRQLGLKEVIKLASNENPLGPSPLAVKALRNGLSGLNRYPDASCYYLKEKLAKRLNVSTENLVIGNGSDEIITLAVKAFVDKGEEVMISRPTFLIYEIAAQLADAKIKFIPLKDFKYDLERKKKEITKNTKLVFIANPDNPTGTYVTKKEVEEFLKGLPKDLIIFFDEAYNELADARDYPDSLKYLNKGNVIIARSFSKAYGLAGLRIGYAIANKTLAGYMDKVREPFNVNSLAQLGASAALDDTKFLTKTKSLLKESKKYLYNEFDKLGLEYIPSQTNFILVNVNRDSKEIFLAMLKKGIIIRDMSAWGLSNYIRVTIGTKKDNSKLIAVLKHVLNK